MSFTIPLKSRIKISATFKPFYLFTVSSIFLLVFSGCSSKFRGSPVELSEYIKNKKVVPYVKKTPKIKHTKPVNHKKVHNKAYPKPYKVFGKWYHPLPHAKGFKQQGIASWYGEAFHGRNTSNGEVYNMYEISAAHKILPLGTYVRVHNIENGKTLDLRINDRGPFVPGRIIDLSKAAAKTLGVYTPGTARVEIIALGMPSKPTSQNGYQSYTPTNYYRGNFKIQVGAFRDRNNAEKLRQELNQYYKNAQIKPYYTRRGGSLLYRVLVGSCSDLNQAEQYESILKTKGFRDAFTVAD